MATKNLQVLALRNAVKAVRVTGMDCGSMQADGKFQAHFLSLLWHPLVGRPVQTGPDSFPAEDNAGTAEAVLWTGRSKMRGVVSTRTATPYQALATIG